VTARQGTEKLAIVAYGSMTIEALKAAEILTTDNIDVNVINARFAKPLDEKIVSLLNKGFSIITVEDHTAACGFGSAVLEAAAKAGADASKITVLGINDEFIKADKRYAQLDTCGISAGKIFDTVKKILRP
ncbi:MAG: transketolase C-terminal domain-containing protein, partial [Phycisphaerae bacterium]|nr:transketolase C-terminal domain-containing protein [Phycisphaerae bacterium]